MGYELEFMDLPDTPIRGHTVTVKLTEGVVAAEITFKKVYVQIGFSRIEIIEILWMSSPRNFYTGKPVLNEKIRGLLMEECIGQARTMRPKSRAYTS